MYYVIYKTTNTLNGKFYIGKHQTKNLEDGYIGSGKYFTRAVKKYGKHNFTTQILEVYDAKWKMDLAERILVVMDLEVSYNLIPGGITNTDYFNEVFWTFDKRSEKSKRLASKAEHTKKLTYSKEERSRWSKKGLQVHKDKYGAPFGGRPDKRGNHTCRPNSAETRAKISSSKRGTMTGSANSKAKALYDDKGNYYSTLKECALEKQVNPSIIRYRLDKGYYKWAL